VPIATEVSVTAVMGVANRHVWPVSAEPPGSIRIAESVAATMPVANDACVRDSANASKSQN